MSTFTEADVVIARKKGFKLALFFAPTSGPEKQAGLLFWASLKVDVLKRGTTRARARRAAVRILKAENRYALDYLGYDQLCIQLEPTADGPGYEALEPKKRSFRRGRHLSCYESVYGFKPDVDDAGYLRCIGEFANGVYAPAVN